MNILVTGCAGFIGYHLINHLVKYNNTIYGCDNLSSKSNKTQRKRFINLKKNKKFKFKRLDLKNYKSFSKYYKKKKINLVVHLAAQPGVRISQEQPIETIDQNIKTFSNIMEFCKEYKVKHFFYASSSSVYGNDNNFNEKFFQKNVSSIYAATKVCNEIFANVYNYLYGINTLGLRFFTVYGPYGREDMAYYKFLNEIKTRNKIIIYGGKKSIRSFISGSIAQFSINVGPLACTAANIAFSVAPTETLGNLKFAPLSPLVAEATIYPFLIFIFAPNFFSANKCKSTGLVPIAHPPGSETFAFPHLLRIGPKTKTPALIVFTSL